METRSTGAPGNGPSVFGARRQALARIARSRRVSLPARIGGLSLDGLWEGGAAGSSTREQCYPKRRSGAMHRFGKSSARSAFLTPRTLRLTALLLAIKNHSQLVSRSPAEGGASVLRF